MLSPQVICNNLRFLERVDVVTSAIYRQLAQDVLANPEVNVHMREEIADRLNHANHELEMQTVGSGDSY
jgi:hypothetical protein